LKKYLKDILFIIVAVFILSNVISYFKKPDIDDIDTSLISKYQNNSKPLLVYFWAPWCSVCKLQKPNIKTISKYFDVLSIAVSETKPKDIGLKTLHDKDSSIAKAFKVSGFPTIFIFDSNKKIRFIDIGYTSTISLAFKMWWVKSF